MNVFKCRNITGNSYGSYVNVCDNLPEFGYTDAEIVLDKKFTHIDLREMVLMVGWAWILVSLTLGTMTHVTHASLYDHSAADSLLFIDDFPHEVTIATPILIYGATYTTIYIWDNGLVTFDDVLRTTLVYTDAWIAPFGADINAGDLKKQEFDVSSTAEITRANNLVSEIYPDDGFLATYIIVITWSNVKTWSLSPTDKVNTFQLVIATDGSTKSYAIFLYETIQWYYAKAIGVSSGNPDDYYILCSSESPNAFLLPQQSNSQCATTPGLVALRIDQTSKTNDFSCVNTYTPITCTSSPGIPCLRVRVPHPRIFWVSTTTSSPRSGPTCVIRITCPHRGRHNVTEVKDVQGGDGPCSSRL